MQDILYIYVVYAHSSLSLSLLGMDPCRPESISSLDFKTSNTFFSVTILYVINSNVSKQ